MPILALTAALALMSRQGSYRVISTTKVGGEGTFDYVYADSSERKLYVPRLGPSGKVTVFNLPDLTPAGEIPGTSGHGVAADAKYGHAFASSKPVAMWDSKSLNMIKTIPVDGRPDGIMEDSFNHRVYVFSHSAPNATVIDAKDGSIVGTIDLGGAPEQAASDGKGKIYIDLEDKGEVAVVDAKTMKVVTTYGLNGKAAGCTGLAIDAKNHVLFVGCREPAMMVVLDANTGNYLTSFSIGAGCDGVIFNPKTMEAYSSQRDGTLTIVKESGPTSFSVEQTVTTMPGAKTCAFDPKTGRIYLIAAEYGPAPEGDAGKRGPVIPGSFSILTVGK